MKEFPFDIVYDYFAKPIVKSGLDSGMFEPKGYLVEVQEGTVYMAKPLPQYAVNSFFSSNAGKNALKDFLHIAMGAVGYQPYCVVLVAESYYKKIDNPTPEQIEEGNRGSLADDPLAEDAIMIAIHRPEAAMMGMLPIMANRTVKFEPLMTEGKLTGRLSGEDYRERPKDASTH